jgi:predicted MFS family arabinose efflux permease
MAAHVPALEAATPVQASFLMRWYVLIVTVAVYTLSIVDRYCVSQVLDPIKHELQLTDYGVGLLSGFAIGLFYVSLGFPLSWLIDRSNRQRIMAACVVAWSAMTVATGLARTSWQFLGARIGVGIGEAGGTPGANSLLSDYFPALRRPMALTIFSLGAPIGAYLASDVAGRIADLWGWRRVFLLLGIPGVIFGLLILFTVPEPRRGQLDPVLKANTPGFLETMRYLWSQKSAVHVMTGSALTALWGWGLMWWTPAFLQRNYGLSIGQSGAMLGDINLIGGGIATLATGWLLALPSMKDPRRIVWLMGTIIGLCTFVSIGIYWTHSLALTRLLFWIFIPSIYFYIGPCFGLLLNLGEPRMRAMYCATTLFLANVGNLMIAPQVIGWISDYVGPNHVANADSLRFAMLCLAPTGFWATFHYFWSARRIVADQERATGVKI